MKVLIEIDEKKWIYAREHNFLDMGSNELANTVINGTPLPKGHGRLIDADVVVDGFEDNYELCIAVNATPTIVEADKENESEAK